MHSPALSIHYLHQNITGVYFLIFSLLIFGLSTLVYLILHFYTMRNYRIFRAYQYLVIVYLFWLFCYIFELISVDPAIKKVWYDLHFLSMTILPFYWFSMILIYYDFPRFVMPIRYFGDTFTFITALLFIKNNKTGLLYSNFQIKNNGFIDYVSVEHGTWYYIILGAYMLVFFVMLVIIFQGIFSKQRSNKKLVYIFIYSILVIFIGGVLNHSQYQIIPNVNHILLFSPIITIPIIIFSRDDDSLGTIPYAYRLIIDNLTDGIVIINPKNKIVTVNKTAIDIFPILKLENILTYVQYNLIEPKEFIPDLEWLVSSQEKIRFENIENEKYYELTVTKANEYREFMGYILNFKDISHHFKAYQKIENIARTDALTKTINRSYFEESFSDLVKSLSYGSSVSIAVVDLDKFKEINDEYGHLTGDQILQTFAKIVRKNTRETDLIIRYGGDEFIIIFSNVKEHVIHEIFSVIQKEFNKAILLLNLRVKFVTFSYGIYSYNLENEDSINFLNDAIDLADKNMYLNKKNKSNFLK